MRLLYVKWLDAARGDDTDLPQHQVGVMRETVGWQVKRTTEGIVLAFSRDSNGTFERWFDIPAVYIKRVRVLGTVP